MDSISFRGTGLSGAPATTASMTSGYNRTLFDTYPTFDETAPSATGSGINDTDESFQTRGRNDSGYGQFERLLFYFT